MIENIKHAIFDKQTNIAKSSFRRFGVIQSLTVHLKIRSLVGSSPADCTIVKQKLRQIPAFKLILAAGVRDLAASKVSEKYHIKLADWLFVDPTFSKKYSTYLPLKKTFLNSRLVDIMSPTCFKLVVFLLDHAHIVRSSCYDLDANVFPSCREPVENVLLRLEEYQILTDLSLERKKERKKLKEGQSEDPKVKNEPIEFLEKITKKEKETDFFEILNSTQLNHNLLTKAEEISAIENFLKNENAFGQFIPPIFQKSRSKVLATLACVYGDPELFRADLNAIINEKNTDEKTGFSKSDYILARVKNKALELHNATR